MQSRLLKALASQQFDLAMKILTQDNIDLSCRDTGFSLLGYCIAHHINDERLAALLLRITDINDFGSLYHTHFELAVIAKNLFYLEALLNADKLCLKPTDSRINPLIFAIQHLPTSVANYEDIIEKIMLKSDVNKPFKNCSGEEITALSLAQQQNNIFVIKKITALSHPNQNEMHNTLPGLYDGYPPTFLWTKNQITLFSQKAEAEIPNPDIFWPYKFNQ